MTLLEQVAAAFAGGQVNVDDLPQTDPDVSVGRACENLFTGGVDVLRSIVPNDRIRALGRVVWDLVGNKRVLVAIGPNVPSLTFTVAQIKNIDQAIILFPKRWPHMVTEDPFMQLGAILFVGVQAVDFYNDRLIGDRGALRRWQAYEAELLRTFKTVLPRFEPNPYQREVLALCPDGLDGEGVDLYPYKGYEPSKGDA